jgi:hypothetical protein
MKPKTKMHYEILQLHKKLPVITDAQIKWGYKHNFKFYAWKTKHKAVCFECGHAWDLERTLITTLFPIICPKCKRKLEQADSHAWRKTELDYMQIFTTIGDFQVVRMVQMYHWMMKTVEAHYSWHELYQHWIHKDGSLNIMSGRFNSMGCYTQGMGWSWCGEMELRTGARDGWNNRYFINEAAIHPKTKIHPYIIRNGYIKEFHQYNEGWFFHLLLSMPIFEIFLKTGQYSLLQECTHMTHRIEQYQAQIRICMKRHYIITNASDWFNYLELLQHFHKNIFDPELICPTDLNEAHDKIVAEKRAIDDRNRAREQEKREQDNKVFRLAKKKLMHLEFTDGEITIVPLKNVMDFKNEERILNHCVYSSEYHKKDMSFIMSARKGTDRMETMEISLKDFSLRQCRGHSNKDSQYHKQILELISKNLRNIEIAFKMPSKPKKKVALVA